MPVPFVADSIENKTLMHKSRVLSAKPPRPDLERIANKHEIGSGPLNPRPDAIGTISIFAGWIVVAGVEVPRLRSGGGNITCGQSEDDLRLRKVARRGRSLKRLVLQNDVPCA